MTQFAQVCEELKSNQKTWLITGVAGFIGSNLLETLLLLDQKVIGLDNFATGFQHNLDEVQSLVSEQQWKNFTFWRWYTEFWRLPASMCRSGLCLAPSCFRVCTTITADPIMTNSANITGFLNMLVQLVMLKYLALLMQRAVWLMVTIRHCLKWKKISASHFRLMPSLNM